MSLILYQGVDAIYTLLWENFGFTFKGYYNIQGAVNKYGFNFLNWKPSGQAGGYLYFDFAKEGPELGEYSDAIFYQYNMADLGKLHFGWNSLDQYQIGFNTIKTFNLNVGYTYHNYWSYTTPTYGN